jgi:RimJ/RimL family protein N-acetyltransferase
MIFETDFMKLYEELNDINSSEDNNAFFTSLLDELSKFDYAFINADGKELDDEEAMKAVVQSPDQLEDLKKGVCTDFVEYTRAKLDDRKIPYEVYYIGCTDKDGDRPSHVFVVIENEGKFLWLEAAWHSEAGIHEYNSLEELFEDIARKHCIYEGENYLKSCEIREIKKSLVGMSQEAIYDYVDTLPITWKAVEEGITEELEATQVANIEAMDKAIQEHFGQDKPGDGCVFIAPNGKFLNIYPELDDHESLAYWLQEQGFEEAIEEAEWFVKAFSYVRCRNSLSQCYIELPIKNITRYQLYSLEDWLETKVNTPTLDIEVPNGEWKNYDLDEYFPEDIIKLIKRCYASGRLYENKSNINYKDISDIELFKEYADDILDGYGNMSDADIKSTIKEIHFEGKLAGYIGFSEYEENGSKCLGIGNFMIIERGKGIGSAVIQNIVEKYKNQYDLIYCFVDAKNEGAIRLYKKLGKVYDEDGPNDNGEYYVTFWDNGKWDLDESLGRESDLIFLSDKNMGGKTLIPRVPNNFLIKNGYEDSVTPRVCFADSIDKALMAISRNLTGEELYVHQPKNINKKAIYKPTIKEVPDVNITGEIWYKEPVELECIGKILVTADDGKDGHKYTYGNKTAELFGWDWDWLEN